MFIILNKLNMGETLILKKGIQFSILFQFDLSHYSSAITENVYLTEWQK